MAAKLDVTVLLDRARAQTGLSDFGDAWFVEPLATLVECVNAEAGLRAPDSGAGARIQSALSDRLQLVQYFKDHPQALEEQIQIACAVIGLPRTGSTIIQRMLASSPKLTSLYWWETAFPLPFPGEAAGDPTPRHRAAKAFVDQLLTEWPDFESIDPMDAMAPNEEVVLLDRTFLSTSYDSMMPIHSYGTWQADQDHESAYRDLLLWLKAIQHQSPWRRGRRWVLKSPHHVLGGIGGLLKIFPDTKLVMTHRNLDQVLPSYCSMCASLTANGSTTYRPEKQGAYWTRRFKTGLERFMALRESLPPEQVIDIRYTDTVIDPAGVAERVMTAAGVGFDQGDRAAVAACIAANAREKRPRHKYAAATFGLSPEATARDFAFYHDRYL